MDCSVSMFQSCVKNTFVHVVIPPEAEQMIRSSSCPPGTFEIALDAEEDVDQTLSVGSAMHFAGDCKPCAWRWKTGGCANKLSCRFCHICPDGALKKRRRAKLQDVKEAARIAAAQKEEQEQALKAAAAQRKQKYNSYNKRSNGQKDAFKLSAVSLEDLFHELKRRNDVTSNRSAALSWSSVSTALSQPRENRFASASSSLSTASPRSLSPSSNSSAFDPLAASKGPMRPWNRDRASRDLLRAKQREQ
jgi:hypothetical protein